MSLFTLLKMLPDDPILKLPLLYRNDPREKKVNLGVGAYRDKNGKPLVLNAVQKAEELLLHQTKEYLPIDGDPEFISASIELILGAALYDDIEKRSFGMQTLGGSGALRIGSELLANQKVSCGQAFVSSPTWPNHQQIFGKAGLAIGSYPYFDIETQTLDFAGFTHWLEKAPEKSVIVLHGGCHNPTGVDLNQEQWKILSSLFKNRKLIPFFDMAYLGFKDDVFEDAWPLRHFIEEGHTCLAAISFSKNFGLYGERVGLLAVVAASEKEAEITKSHCKQLVRANYSTPPIHGGGIVKKVLKTPELKKDWENELKLMKDRIAGMRTLLSTSMKSRDFSFVENQNGLFSLLGLTREQVQTLQKEHGIYLPSSGRVNFAGLNQNNIEIVSEALAKVL